MGDPTDGRKPYEWKSRYPDEATPIIRQESCFSVGVLLLALLLILFTWLGYPAKVLGVDGVKAASLQKYCYYAFSGLLGGAVFGVKYLYRVVARGYWHVDRRLWRFMSPFVAMAVAFAMGALIEANYLSARTPISGAATIGLGFLVGHFADQAVAKLHELANVLFGAVAKTSESQSRPPKQSG